MLIDLHTHTFPSSDDSLIGPDELVEAAKNAGLDGLCLTEHDYFWDPVDIISMGRRHDFLVLPGCEVNTDSGHVLVFGLKKYVFGMHKVAHLSQLAQRAGAVLIAAHPYRRRYRPEEAGNPGSYRSMVEAASRDTVFSSCHAMEAVNGRAGDAETRFCLDLGQRTGLAMAGGSDSHRLLQVGTVATRFHIRITCLDDLTGEIKAGRFEPVVLESRQKWEAVTF